MKRAASFYLIAFLVFAWTPGLFAADDVIRGRLEASPEQLQSSDPPLLFITDDGQRFTLAGDEYSTSQLGDPRLKGRHWELRGARQPDGVFEVLRLFTIKDAKTFRVTYFCVICNIRSHHAGECMCCQEETELQELPVEQQ